jgi:hypothetical protein
MRFISDPPPKYGTVRELQFFAWLPEGVYRQNGGSEWRWLERVRIKQVYSYLGGSFWVNEEFLDLLP